MLFCYYFSQVRSVRQCAEFIAFGGVAIGLTACGFIDNRYAAYSCMIIVQVCLHILMHCKPQ